MSAFTARKLATLQRLRLEKSLSENGYVENIGAALARAQFLSVFELGESLQALCLDLPDPFPRQMEDMCDLFQ